MNEEFSIILKEKMDGIQNLNFYIPLFGKINVVEELKRIKRNGKKVRLSIFGNEKIKPRSIYDHVLSLGYYFSVFLKRITLNCDLKEIAILVAYHDLCESLIGDYPEFSNQFLPELSNDLKVKVINKEQREKVANDFLCLFAPDEMRLDFAKTNELTLKKDFTYTIFKVFDVTDPIVSVWRYLYKFENEIKGSEERFITIMTDFFDNPVLDKIISENQVGLLTEIIKVLKNKNNALIFSKTHDFSSFCSSEVSNLLTELIIRYEGL